MIEIVDVTRRFAGKNGSTTTAIEEVNVTLDGGSFVSFVGPSGCGKSTLLSLVSGLDPVVTGAIRVNGEAVKGIRRDAAMMLQADSLLPWRTVRANIGLALQIRKIPKAQQIADVNKWIDLIGLTKFADHYPAQLSGGMRKRVQLAASLVYNPSIVLMDEPFAALDAFTRANMQQTLLELWQSLGSTVLFVTHDLDEAIALSDRVVVFTKSPGTIKAIYDIDLPRPRDVADIRNATGFSEIRHRIWLDLKEELDIPELGAADNGAGRRLAVE